MSVVSSNRSESSMQFIQTARELQIYMIKCSVKSPKRYTFIINNEIAKLGNEIFMNAKYANSIYPTNQDELQIRINYIDRAVGSLYNLISMLDTAKEVFGIEDKIMVKAMGLITEELKLLKALKKSDKEKYKNK